MPLEQQNSLVTVSAFFFAALTAACSSRTESVSPSETEPEQVSADADDTKEEADPDKEASEDEPQTDNAECRLDCDAGDERCSDSAIEVCIIDEEGCPSWQSSVDCRDMNRSCERDDKVAACSDACIDDADCDGVRTEDDCDDTDDSLPTRDDADCDGFAEEFDCDDTDAETYPGAPEGCDPVDRNCDGRTVSGDVNVSEGDDLSVVVSTAAKGSTICLGPGMYGAGLLIDRDLTLISSGGSAQTFVDGQGTSNLVSITAAADQVDISGITFQGGFSSSSTVIPGIKVLGSGLSLTSVVVRDVSWTADDGGSLAEGIRGAALRADNADLTLTDVMITQVVTRSVRVLGGAISALNSTLDATRLQILDSTVTSTTDGAALWIQKTTEASTLSNVILAGNKVESSASPSVNLVRFNGEDAVNLKQWTITGNVLDKPTGTATLMMAAETVVGNVVGTTLSQNTEDGPEGLWAWGTQAGSIWNISYSNTHMDAGDTRYAGPGLENVDNDLEIAVSFNDTTAQLAENWDLSLPNNSLLFDAGDPGVLDVNASRSDIGAFGGPDAFE